MLHAAGTMQLPRRPTAQLALYGPLVRGLHSFTFQLNLSRVCRKKPPYTPSTSPNTPLTRATQFLRATPIPYKALKFS